MDLNLNLDTHGSFLNTNQLCDLEHYHKQHLKAWEIGNQPLNKWWLKTTYRFSNDLVFQVCWNASVTGSMPEVKPAPSVRPLLPFEAGASSSFPVTPSPVPNPGSIPIWSRGTSAWTRGITPLSPPGTSSLPLDPCRWTWQISSTMTLALPAQSRDHQPWRTWL